MQVGQVIRLVGENLSRYRLFAKSQGISFKVLIIEGNRKLSVVKLTDSILTESSRLTPAIIRHIGTMCPLIRCTEGKPRRVDHEVKRSKPSRSTW